MVYGKVYNEKRREESDAEFILHENIKIKGESVFSKLNGSFALAVFNDHDGRLILVSDRFGTRPLYYAVVSGDIVFSSEVKAILKYPMQTALNKDAIVRFFRWGKLGILGEDTWFKGVKVLPASSILKFEDGKVAIRKYWELEYLSGYNNKSMEDVALELAEAFRRAVNIRVSENLSYGVLLSGGLDSRSVIGALDESLLDKVQAATFGVKGCDDIRVAGAFTRKIGLKRHHTIEYDLDLTANYAKNVVYLTDGMGTVNISYLPNVLMKLKQSIDVYLQGFAFDLLLGGSYLDKETMRARNISDLVHALDKKYTLFSQSELEHLLGEKLIPFAKKIKCFS